MQSIAVILFVFSISLLAQDPCDGLKVYPSMIRLETDPKHPCNPEMNDVKDRIVVRKPGYDGLDTLEKVAEHELGRGWCGLGGHYYVDQEGRITQGRPEYMKGANEVIKDNNRGIVDGNTGKLGIQVLLPESSDALSAYFVGNFTQLLRCQMSRHYIARERVKPHFFAQFHPGKLVADLIKKLMTEDRFD